MKFKPSAAKRVKEALAVLVAIGIPREQQNERSALTLLALVNLPPRIAWSNASSPLRRITEMMDWMGKSMALIINLTLVKQFGGRRFINLFNVACLRKIPIHPAGPSIVRTGAIKSNQMRFHFCKAYELHHGSVNCSHGALIPTTILSKLVIGIFHVSQSSCQMVR